MAGEHLHITLSSVKPADVVMSPDGSRLYAGGLDGKLRIYELPTSTYKGAWSVGTELGGIDVSPDGKFLIAVERQPLAMTTAPDLWDSTTTVTTYKIRLSDGQTTSFDKVMEGSYGVFFDVAVMSDGTALLGQSFREVTGSSDLVWRLNPSTGVYTHLRDPYVTEDVMLWRSRDGSRVLIGPDNSSDAPLHVYRPVGGLTAQHGNYEDGVRATSLGVSAFGLEANLVVQSVGRVYVYTAQLDYLFELSAKFPQFRGPGIVGLAFDGSAKNLYILDQRTDSITQISTADWKIVRTFDVGVEVDDPTEQFPDGDYGNRLQVSPDGAYFTVVTGSGVQLVANHALANVFAGTGGADDFSAGLGNDEVSGRGGHDRIDGGAGNDLLRGEAGDDRLLGGTGIDRLEGGVGNDVFVVDNSADLIVELAGQGTDAVTALATYTLPAGVENLTLGGSDSIGATGNAQANVLTGNTSQNRLDGGAGADWMAGGKASDLYVVDNAGDRVVEEGSSGTDTVRSFIDYQLPAHVERLVLVGSAAIDGRGNSGANTIIGNAGANLISAGSGNDVIDAGAGDDRIYGYTGNDSLKGGTGLDRFLFNSALGPDNVDKILDFYAPSDSIYLSRSVFTKVGANGPLSASAFHQGTAAGAADDRIVYDQATGRIFYDADGSGAGSAVLFATVTAGTALGAADFIIYS